MEGDQKQSLDRPDHTRVQVIAVVQAAIAVAVAFGVSITDGQSVALVALAGVMGSVLIAADAAIRRERARNADKLIPHASLTKTEGPEGVQTTTAVNGPTSDLSVKQFHEALRQFLGENGLVLTQAPPRSNSDRSVRRRVASRS
jgi:hypothetical protein